MKPTPETTNLDDAALRAVLDAQDGPAWQTALAPEASVLAPAWEQLAGEVEQALRMGPGGLSDAQRLQILAAAGAPVAAPSRAAGLPAVPELARVAARSRWRAIWPLAIAAAAAVAALVWLVAPNRERDALANAPVPVAEPVAVPVAEPGAADGVFRIRVMPGDAYGSRYAGTRTPSNPVTQPGAQPALPLAASGFQPAAQANVTELVPAFPVGDLPPLPDYFANAGGNHGGVSAGEMINAFAYSYPEPAADDVVGMTIESGACPWNKQNLLVHIGLKARADTGLASARLRAIADDLRLVVEFNPARVAAYRIIGADAEPAGASTRSTPATGAKMTPGQAVTVLYEIVPAGGLAPNDPRWTNLTPAQAGDAGDVLAARVMFHQVGRPGQRECLAVLTSDAALRPSPSEDFRFAAAVAAAAMRRNHVPGLQDYTYANALGLARSALGKDPDGRRARFVSQLGARAAE